MSFILVPIKILFFIQNDECLIWIGQCLIWPAGAYLDPADGPHDLVVVSWIDSKVLENSLHVLIPQFDGTSIFAEITKHQVSSIMAGVVAA